MASKSIFRDFITALRKRWKKDYPFIRSIDEPRGRLPKASSFYAGVIKDSSVHVFLNFQHSNKSWEVGQFTINVILSSDEFNPKLGMSTRSALDLGEGSHRIGHILGSKDKWWHLKRDDEPMLTQAWRPTSYRTADKVISEAVDDVTKDVLSAMRLLGVPDKHETSA